MNIMREEILDVNEELNTFYGLIKLVLHLFLKLEKLVPLIWHC